MANIPVAVYKGRASVAPGLWQMSAHDYHSGPAPDVELSSSVLQALLAGSPLHAWTACGRLNTNAEREDARRMEIGSVAHKLVLGAGAEIEVLQFNDYRKKEAQERRDEAKLRGKIPVLACDLVRAEELAIGMRVAVEAYMGLPIDQCLREVVALWKDGLTGHWRKSMLDIVSPDLLRVADLKTTAASVAPGSCARRMYDGYDVQAAFYLSGLDAIHPAGRGRREFAFIFAETSAPFAVSPPMILSEAGSAMASQKVIAGSALWDGCLAKGEWPAFDQTPQIAEPPSYLLQEWEMRMGNDFSSNPTFEEKMRYAEIP